MAGSGAAAGTDEVAVSGAPSIRIADAGQGMSELAGLQQATQSNVAGLPEGIQHVLALEAAKYSSGEIGALGSAQFGLDTPVTFAEVGGMLCVVQGDGDPGYSYGCWSLSEAVSGDAYLAVPQIDGNGNVKVIGVAPNGTETVSVDSGTDGRSDAEASVSSNLWMAELGPVETEISGIDQSGQVDYQFKLPLQFFTKSQMGG